MSSSCSDETPAGRQWLYVLAAWALFAGTAEAQLGIEFVDPQAVHADDVHSEILDAEVVPAPHPAPELAPAHTIDMQVTPAAWHPPRPPLPSTIQQSVARILDEGGRGLRQRYWANADLLVWWGKQMNTPPLVENGDGSVLYGGQREGQHSVAGLRLDLGYWLGPRKAIGASFITLGQRGDNFDSSQTGESVVVRPFIQNGVPQVLVVNFPPDPNGNVFAETNSEFLMFNAFCRRKVWCHGATNVDLLGGYQLARIDESLTIRHRFDSGGVLFDGDDQFSTKNEFHGAALGVLLQHRFRCWRVDLLGRLGLGNMRGTVIVAGSNPAGTGTNASLLARESNVGRRSENQFAAVRELGMNWIYHWGQCTDFVAGYSLIYFKHVVQPGDQIDLNLPNPQRLFNDSSYWVHGLNFGVQRRF